MSVFRIIISCIVSQKMCGLQFHHPYCLFILEKSVSMFDFELNPHTREQNSNARLAQSYGILIVAVLSKVSTF